MIMEKGVITGHISINIFKEPIQVSGSQWWSNAVYSH